MVGGRQGISAALLHEHWQGVQEARQPASQPAGHQPASNPPCRRVCPAPAPTWISEGAALLITGCLSASLSLSTASTSSLESRPRFSSTLQHGTLKQGAAAAAASGVERRRHLNCGRQAPGRATCATAAADKLRTAARWLPRCTAACKAGKRGSWSMQRSHLHMRAAGVGGAAISSGRRLGAEAEGRWASWRARPQVGNRLVGQGGGLVAVPDSKYTTRGQKRKHANSGAPGAAMASHSNANATASSHNLNS